MPKPRAAVAIRGLLLAAILVIALPAATASAGSGGAAPPSVLDPAPVPGAKAKVLPSGLAAAPVGAPVEVQRAIAAGNAINEAGYCTGGGHANSTSPCYDCSGAVSYILGPKGAGILDSPLPSYGFNKWGEPGKGGWITVYYNKRSRVRRGRGHSLRHLDAGRCRGRSRLGQADQGRLRQRAVQEALLPGPLRARLFHFRRPGATIANRIVFGREMLLAASVARRRAT